MRILLASILALVSTSSFLQSNEEARPLKYFDSGLLFYERILPACVDYNAAGIPNYNVGGIEGDFLTMTFGQWKWKQRVSASFGWREKPDLIPNIDFEGGYVGGFSVWSTHFNASIGTVISFQPHPSIEIGIPALFSARRTSDYGRYFLYEGQSVSVIEDASEIDASQANKVMFNKKWIPGLRAGLELVLFPNSRLSLLGRINWQYYGWRDVYDIASARLNAANNTIEVDHDRVWSTPEWGFTLGLRYYFITAGEVETKQKDKKDKPNVILTPEKRQ